MQINVVLCMQCEPRFPSTLLNGLPVITQNYQTDWEAILSRNAADFISSVSAWMYPVQARNGGGAVDQDAGALGCLPLVKDVLGTARVRLEALNGEPLA
jgi:hypothetical protein